MANLVYLNGDWLAASSAKVSVNDRGFLFADGIYEVIPVYQRRPFLLNLHLERLQRSAQAIGLAIAPLASYQSLVTGLFTVTVASIGLVILQLTSGPTIHVNT